ncbi:MAG: hypothetical protein RJQ04_20595 [Longimicrobiales bacterium]
MGGPEGRLADVQAIIQSAKARGGREALERFIERRLPASDLARVGEAAEVVEEIVDSIPIFLARARQEAEARKLESVVGPLLDHAERYFVQPMDLIPEMTQGLPGLMDDAYLVIRILQNLEKGPRPFLDWDLEYPMVFLRRIMGEEVSRQLDGIALEAMEEASAQLTMVWSHLAAEA